MKDLELRDSQVEKHVPENQCHLARGQINQIHHEASVNQLGCAWHECELAVQHNKTEKVKQMKRHETKLIEKKSRVQNINP